MQCRFEECVWVSGRSLGPLCLTHINLDLCPDTPTMILQAALRTTMMSSSSSSLLLKRASAAASHTLRSRSASADATQENKKETGQQGLLGRLLGPDSAVAAPSFTNRWSMFVPAFATHVCLGAPYGWSAISAQLSRENGIVASSSSDWALDVCSYPMSVMVSTPQDKGRGQRRRKRRRRGTGTRSSLWCLLQIAAGGLSAALFGKWTMKVGVRAAMATGGSLFAGGFLLSSFGVMQHNLPMLYAGNRKNVDPVRNT